MILQLHVALACCLPKQVIQILQSCLGIIDALHALEWS